MSTDSSAIRDPDPTSKMAWKSIVAKYQQPSAKRAVWQLINTFVPYVLLWYLMYAVSDVSLWLAIPLAVLAGAFLVRIFIIFHDCGHGSFFTSRRANDVLGFIAGVLTFGVAYLVGEPPVASAIAVEEATESPVADADHDHDQAATADGHSHAGAERQRHR